MPITSLLGRNLDPYSFQRGIAVFDFRFNRVWHYATRRRTRPVSLRPVLLRHVYGRPARGRMGNVGTEALTVRSTLEPLFNLPKRTRRVGGSPLRKTPLDRRARILESGQCCLEISTSR